ncbi:zinc-dependent alcohol dehydrogenase [Amedibacillus sp. YH-ame6]
MKQVILENRESLVINNSKDIELFNDDEVLIQVKAVTICGSDISYYRAESLPHNLNYPLILGHEVAGKIVKVGKNITKFSIGDRVAIEPNQYCHTCNYCERGEYNFCESLKFMASKGLDGAMQEYIHWPAENVYKIYDNMTYEEGALLEPLSVAYSAIEKLDLSKDSHLAILGAGSIGILIGLLVKSIYPDIQYHLIDQFDEKMQLGVVAGIDKKNFLIGSAYDLKAIQEFTHIIDTTGVADVIKRYINHSVYGVRVVLVGVSNQEISLSCKDIVYKGVELIGSYRYTNTYEKLLKIYKDNGLRFKQIITKYYPFVESQKAFIEAMDTKHNIKIAIMFE